MSEEPILYRVEGKIAVITINRPKHYNALNTEQYWALEEAVKRAAIEPGTVATLVEGTGEFFSAGADFKTTKFLSNSSDGEVDLEARRLLAGPFTGRNAIIADTFWHHPKVLVIALNGPVIGLSVGIVALADIIIARDNAYILTPFSNLRLSSEGATAFSLPQRLGLSLANQALLLSEPVYAKDLFRTGFVSKLYPQSVSTDEFNRKVLEYLAQRLADLDPRSLLEIKQLVHAPMNGAFGQTSASEIVYGLDRFSRGQPQMRFKELANKSRRHKL